MNANRDLLNVTAFVSALLHAVVILGVSFKLPDLAARSNTDNTLDVVLLNSTNNETPEKSELVSSTNNAGGGRDDKEASSPLPYIPVDPSQIQTVIKTANQQPNNTVLPDQFIAFLSPTTTAHDAAKYLADWKRQVVTIGNANYPIKAKAEKLTGTLILTVEINRNGTINALHIKNPSRHKLLNDTALRFVRDASPFASFPDSDYFSKIDILVITRAFHFLPGNRITSAAAQ